VIGGLLLVNLPAVLGLDVEGWVEVQGLEVGAHRIESLHEADSHLIAAANHKHSAPCNLGKDERCERGKLGTSSFTREVFVHASLALVNLDVAAIVQLDCVK